MRSTRTFPLKSWRATAAWSGITKSCPMPNRLSSRSELKLGCLTTNIASARNARVKKRHALDEATPGHPHEIGERLIKPLAALPQARVLVGTRRSPDGATIAEAEP